MPGKFLRGALIEFTETFPIPIPNVIIFQFNPETMTHAWTPARAAAPGAAGGAQRTNPLAVQGTPGETYSFSLAMDAGDMIADEGPIGAALAQASGIYTRLAALEMLLYPTAPPGGGLIGSVTAALSIGGGGGPAPNTPIPAAQVPTVLFVWGPGRILPVRVTALSITEKLYDPLLLNPTHADATISLQVLTPEDLAHVDGPLAGVARTAYDYSQKLRQALALANLGNAVDSIIGMLPI